MLIESAVKIESEKAYKLNAVICILKSSTESEIPIFIISEKFQNPKVFFRFPITRAHFFAKVSSVNDKFLLLRKKNKEIIDIFIVRGNRVQNHLESINQDYSVYLRLFMHANTFFCHFNMFRVQVSSWRTREKNPLNYAVPE